MEETIIEDTIMKTYRPKLPIRFSLKLNLNSKFLKKKLQEILQQTSHILIQLMEVSQRTKDIFSNTLTDQDSFSENQAQDLQVPPLEFTWRNIAQISTKMSLKPSRSFLIELFCFANFMN